MTREEIIEYWEQFSAEIDDLYNTCSDAERGILEKQREVVEFTISAIRELDAQEKLKPMNEWISVNDRLPENEQDVIICAKRRYYSEPNRFFNIIAKAFYADGKHDTEHTAYAWDNDYMDMEYDDEKDAYLIPEGWWESVEYGEDFCAVSDFVTHWMLMPEPPKEEKK